MTVSKKTSALFTELGGRLCEERGRVEMKEERGNEGRCEGEKETGEGRGHKEHINYLCAYSHG